MDLTNLHPYQLLVDRNISVWNSINLPDMPYIPCLTAGWDRRPWEANNGDGLGAGSSVSPHYDRGTPYEFGQYVENLADWMDANPNKITKDRLAVIYAWNENGEGGWLMPTKNDPEGAYLKVIRKVVFEK